MIFPIALELTRIPVLLAGNGELMLRRLAYLDEAQAGSVAVFSDQPSEALRKAAGHRLIERLPTSQDIENYTVVMVAGLPRPVAERMVASARLLGRLINVEDINDLCDFYFTANIRRGDLVIAVSTSGASPTLARKIRDWLANYFGQEWAGYVDEMAQLRKSWKAQGLGFNELIANSERHLASKGWLRAPSSLLQQKQNKTEDAA